MNQEQSKETYKEDSDNTLLHLYLFYLLQHKLKEFRRISSDKLKEVLAVNVLAFLLNISLSTVQYKLVSCWNSRRHGWFKASGLKD